LRLIKNPVSNIFSVISGGLLIVSVLGRMSFDNFDEALQFIFIPYTYDFARKIGQSQEDWIVLILVIMQVLLIVSIFTVARVTSHRFKLLMSIIGVIWVVRHYQAIDSILENIGDQYIAYG
jgi:hypothetical protein